MKITKYGHCCLLLEIEGTRILTDPGIFSTTQNEIKDIDVVVITHDHQDHYHVDSVKKIIANNPEVKIITTSFMAGLLDKENIKNYEIVDEGQSTIQKNIKIEAYGTKHAQMHSSIPQTSNTGYFFADTLFYPGDAFTDPKRHIDILALPVAGPWMKISEAIDYALALKPTKAFAVHDAVMTRPELASNWPNRVLPPNGIEFLVLEIGKEYDF
ncbi:MAG: MBL fold metallo-hydrolase [Patescibacteria group bacterium]